MIGVFQETNTKKYHIARYSAIKPLDNSLLLFQWTVEMGRTFLSLLPYYPFQKERQKPTRSDLSGRGSSLQTPLHGQVGHDAPLPAPHCLSSLSPLALHRSPAPLLLGGGRASMKKGRGGAVGLIPCTLCTLSLLRDSGKNSGPDPQKSQGEDKLRWD